MSRLRSLIARYVVPERIPWFAAPLYDKLAGGAIHDYYVQVASEIVTATDRGRILDIGTGPGYLPIEIVKMAPNVRIDAVDLTRKMIRLAGKHAREAKVSDRISFRVGDGNRLAFGDNLFDMVISTGSLHAWKNPIGVFNECYRVLKPGKEAWIYDPAKIMTGATQSMLKRGLTPLERLVMRWAAWTTRTKEPFTKEEIQEMISTLPFREAYVEQTQWLKITLRK